MKGFTRAELRFSLCGLNCGLCPMNLDGYCSGCGGGEGNQSCKTARCSLEHGAPAYCFQCGAFPCENYGGMDEYDSFITHRNRLADMERARTGGLERYQAEQAERPLRERGARVSALLQEAAEREGGLLKLRKKPKNI